MSASAPKQAHSGTAKPEMLKDQGFGEYPDLANGFSGQPLGSLFDAKADATRLHDALATKKDSEVVMDLVAGRVDKEMQEIRKVYESTFKSKLNDDIKKAAMGQYENALLARVTPLAEFEATQLHNAIKGLGTNEPRLIAILTTRTNAELAAIRDYYMTTWKKTLEGDIKGDTTGDFERILVALAAGGRNEDPFVDHGLVERDAAALHKAGEKKTFGTDEDAFITILTKRSPAHLKEVRGAYRKISTSSLEEAIASELGKGDLGRTCLALVNRGDFLCDLVKECVRGLGTDDEGLIALLAHIPKDVLIDTKAEYRMRYKKGMLQDIEDDVSGDYRKLLRRFCCHSAADYYAVLLREAMHGWGTDEDMLTSVICSVPTKKKLEEISDAYMLDYNVHLRDDILKECSGNYGDLLAALVTPRAQLDAEHLHDAMKGLGTKESVLIDILTSRSNSELEQIREKYTQLYTTSLEGDIIGDTSGNFETVLVALARGTRHENAQLRDDAAASVADTLYKGGVGTWGTNDDIWINIFTTRSVDELHLIDQKYTAKYGHNLKKAIEKETSGDYKRALLACVDPIGYASELLYNAMKGLGTDDKALVRLIGGRSKVHLNLIAKRFETDYNTSLVDMVAGDTSGDYKKALLAYLAEVVPPSKGDATPTVQSINQATANVTAALNKAIAQAQKKK